MNGQTLIGELLVIFGLLEVWYSYAFAPKQDLVSFISLSVIGLELILIGGYVLVVNLKPEKMQSFLDKLLSKGK